MVNEFWTAKLLAWNGCGDGEEGKCGGLRKGQGEMQKGKWAVSQQWPMPEDQWRVELKREGFGLSGASKFGGFVCPNFAETGKKH